MKLIIYGALALVSLFELFYIATSPVIRFIEKDYDKDGIYVCHWEVQSSKMTCIRTGLELPVDNAPAPENGPPNVDL